MISSLSSHVLQIDVKHQFYTAEHPSPPKKNQLEMPSNV